MQFPKNAKIERVASQDISRGTLVNPYLDVERKRLMATDGHALVIVPVIPDAADHSGPVTADALQAARKAAGRRSDMAGITVNGAQVIPGGVSFPRPADVRFPPVDTLIPDHGPDAIRVSFNAQLLLRAVEAMGVDGDPVILTFEATADKNGERLAPIKVTTEKGGAFALVMPCRIGNAR